MEFIGEFHEIPDCYMLSTEGIAHNVIFDSIRFVAKKNLIAQNRLLWLSSAQNITFVNNDFTDFHWSKNSFGITQGYQIRRFNECPSNAYFTLLYENNTFINTESQLSSVPFYLTTEYSFPSFMTTIIFRGNTFIN